MSSNQQISDYIYYYPQVLDSNICNNIVNYFDKNAKWEASTFSTAYKNTGTSQVAMEEYWIKQILIIKCIICIKIGRTCH